MFLRKAFIRNTLVISTAVLAIAIAGCSKKKDEVNKGLQSNTQSQIQTEGLFQLIDSGYCVKSESNQKKFGYNSLSKEQVSGLQGPNPTTNGECADLTVFKNDEIPDNLNNTKLSGARAMEKNFKGNNLLNTNFRYAQLAGSDFSGATVGGTDHSKMTDFTGANLRGAKLTHLSPQYGKVLFASADLRGVDFYETKYSIVNLDFTNALMDEAGVKQLELTEEQIKSLKIRVIKTNDERSIVETAATGIMDMVGLFGGRDLEKDRRARAKLGKVLIDMGNTTSAVASKAGENVADTAKDVGHGIADAYLGAEAAYRAFLQEFRNAAEDVVAREYRGQKFEYSTLMAVWAERLYSRYRDYLSPENKDKKLELGEEVVIRLVDKVTDTAKLVGDTTRDGLYAAQDKVTEVATPALKGAIRAQETANAHAAAAAIIGAKVAVKAAENVADAAKDVGGAVKNGAVATYEVAGRVQDKVTEQVTPVLRDAKDAAIDGATFAGKVAVKAAENVADAAKDVGGAVKDLGQQVGAGAAGMARDAYDGLGKAHDTFTEHVGKPIVKYPVLGALKTAEVAGQALDKAVEVQTKINEAVVSAGHKALQTVFGWFQSAKEKVIDTAQGLKQMHFDEVERQKPDHLKQDQQK